MLARRGVRRALLDRRVRRGCGDLFGLTLLTFDGCLGRIPDVPRRPKCRRTGRVNPFAILATCVLGPAALSVCLESPEGQKHKPGA